MTTLVTQRSLSELKGEAVISAPVRTYFQQRLFNNMHQLLLGLVAFEKATGDFSKRRLAKRIEKKPEQVTRWLSYPGNMTLETMSDLVLGMGCELEFGVRRFSSTHEEMIRSNDNIIVGDFKILSKKVTDKVLNQKSVSFFNSGANTKTFITRIEGM